MHKKKKLSEETEEDFKYSEEDLIDSVSVNYSNTKQAYSNQDEYPSYKKKSALKAKKSIYDS